jgi:acrylyl-CoA reductase (NADPH)
MKRGLIAMNNQHFKAYVVKEDDDGTFYGAVQDETVNELPPGEVTVRVQYSSLNYKDALSATGNRAVTKTYPHTPGIDAAGIVMESDAENILQGTPVIVTSYDLGMNTPGGFGQYIRVPADWVVPLPTGLSLRESMIFGTAGFTAGLSVMKLTASVKPEHGPIVVTGATGGVGSVAAAILSKLGYAVTGVSGKQNAAEFLGPLGVKKIIGREAFLENSHRPLLKPLWAGAVDTVGGEPLATAIKSTHPLGVVTCCGNAASPELPITVFPFILRGVSLMGVNSQSCPMNIRKNAWEKLSHDWKFHGLERICQEISLHELRDRIEAILKGRLLGRTVVRLDEADVSV